MHTFRSLFLVLALPLCLHNLNGDGRDLRGANVVNNDDVHDKDISRKISVFRQTIVEKFIKTFALT